jgi:hypothetical protein
MLQTPTTASSFHVDPMESAFLTGKRHYHHVRAIDVTESIRKIRRQVIFTSDLVLSTPDLTKSCAVLSWRWDLTGDGFCPARHELQDRTYDKDALAFCDICSSNLRGTTGKDCRVCDFDVCSGCTSKRNGFKSVNLRSALLTAFSAGFKYMFCDIISIDQSSSELISDVQALLRLYETIPVITSYGKYSIQERILNISVSGASRGWINREMECMSNNKLTLHNPSPSVLDKILAICLRHSPNDPTLNILFGTSNYILKYLLSLLLIPVLFLRHTWLSNLRCSSSSTTFFQYIYSEIFLTPLDRIKEQLIILYLLFMSRDYRGLLYYSPFCFFDLVTNFMALLFNIPFMILGAVIGVFLLLVLVLLIFATCGQSEKIISGVGDVVERLMALFGGLIGWVPLLIDIVLSGVSECVIWLGPIQPHHLLSLRVLKDRIINRGTLNKFLMNSTDPFTTFSDLRFIRDVQMDGAEYSKIDKKALGVRLRIHHLSIALDQLRELGKAHIPTFKDLKIEGVDDPLPPSLVGLLTEKHDQVIRDARLLLFQKPDVSEANYVKPITQDREAIMGKLFRNNSIGQMNENNGSSNNKTGYCCC